jgi:hypothetical protein
MSSASSSNFSELLQFINPSSSEYLLNFTLQTLLQLEEEYYLTNVTLKEKLILFEKISSLLFFSSSSTTSISSTNIKLILSIFVNFSSFKEITFSNFLINSSKILSKCIDFIIKDENNKQYSIQLFCNLSRQFPQQFGHKLIGKDDDFGLKLIGLFFYFWF